MKGYLIQTDRQEIGEIELVDPTKEEANIKQLLDELYTYLLINKGSRLVEQVRLTAAFKPDVLLVDEEGRLRRTTRALGQFSFNGRIFFGRGIVLSETLPDKDGDVSWAAPNMSLKRLKSQIMFFDAEGRPFLNR